MIKSASIVLLISILVFSGMTFLTTPGNLNVYAVDDNLFQWEPVIEEAFASIFEKHTVPAINFYQYKGSPVMDLGFYALFNPLMYLAYFICRYIFDFYLFVLPTYIALMIIFGNLCLFALLKKIGLKDIPAYCSVFFYSTLSFFYLYGFYYYTFNNYFFIPFFLYVWYETLFKKSGYIAPGITLAFGLCLGNAQYGVYYLAFYGVISVFLLLLTRRKEEIYKFFSNIGIFLSLSSAQLVLFFEASLRRFDVLEKRLFNFDEFFSFPINLYDFIFNSGSMVYPDNIMNFGDLVQTENHVFLGGLFVLFFIVLYTLIKDILKKYPISLVEPQRNAFIGLFGVCFLTFFQLTNGSSLFSIRALLSYFVIGLIFVFFFRPEIFKQKKNIPYLICLSFLWPDFFFLGLMLYFVFYGFDEKKKVLSQKDILPLIVLGALCFFMLFGGGRTYFLAPILRAFPVISGFRFLYKCLFFILPLLCIFVFFFGAYFKENKNMMFFYCTLLLVSGFLSLYSTAHIMQKTHPCTSDTYFKYNSDLSYDKVHQIKMKLDQIKVDKENYRVMSLFAYAENYVVEDLARQFNEEFTKNGATLYHVFSAGGYEDSFTQDIYEQNIPYFSNLIVDHIFLNAIPKELLSEYEEKQEKADLLAKAVQADSIKYFLMKKYDFELLKKFKNVIQRIPDFKIKRVINLTPQTLMVEIEGVPPLGVADGQIFLDLKPSMSELSFEKEQNFKSARLSFIYHPRYKAVLKTTDGKEYDLPVLKDKNGYINISFAKHEKDKGTVTLRYQYIFCDFATWLALMTNLLMFLMLLYIQRRKYV